ncbi:MAG: hypothetical protein WBD74_15175 [Candidatus Aquilonibacter sp.]
MDAQQKAPLVRSICGETQGARAASVTCHIVPFITERRPTDEVAHPGLGSSDNASMVLAVPIEGENATIVL